ncbi:MAG: GNAT family N-acetyltransferase, partial [Planctomycetaceae bacterium]|nr:GNAT family N-acetyltransferase [Planctomycetaceae bacterium]
MTRDHMTSAGSDSIDTQSLDHSRLELRWHESAERAHAMRLWNMLAESLEHGPSLTCSPAWVETWLDQYGDLVPHRFVAGYSAEGTLRGMALLCEGVEEHEGPFPVRTLHLGTAGEPEADSVVVEYNRLLADSRWHPIFLRDVLQAMAEDGSCDELRLDGFSLNDFSVVSKSLQPLQLRKEVRTVVSWYFDLDAARAEGGEVISHLGYSTRKHLRKNLRWYTSEGGELTSEWAESVEEAEDIFAEMVQLHQQRWEAAGHPGVYSSERFMRFHQELLRRLVPAGKMVLFRVKCGTELVGCVQLLVDGRRVLAYQGGFAAYDSKHSPGVVVDYLCISECLKRGYSAFDFLGGESSHKQKLSTDSAKLVWVRLKHPRLKYAFAQVGRLLKYGSRTAPSATPPQNGTIRVREVNSLEDLAPLREDWNRLLARTADATWLQSYEWFTEHHRLYCSSSRMRVLVVEDEGHPIGIMPLVLKTVPTSLGEMSCLT